VLSRSKECNPILGCSATSLRYVRVCSGLFRIWKFEHERTSMNRDHLRRIADLSAVASREGWLAKVDSPIRRLMLLLFAHTCLVAMAQAQSPTMLGRWNIEVNFADGNKRSLRFDAQADGKGTFLLVDPMLSRWGPAKPSEAKWTPGDQNSMTFSGPVEFPLGNVGRDAGTLMFKGKFQTPDSISGEVEFAPLVGERPSKHGTFKATRQ
jgi:hypothetical protein